MTDSDRSAPGSGSFDIQGLARIAVEIAVGGRVGNVVLGAGGPVTAAKGPAVEGGQGRTVVLGVEGLGIGTANLAARLWRFAASHFSRKN